MKKTNRQIAQRFPGKRKARAKPPVSAPEWPFARKFTIYSQSEKARFLNENRAFSRNAQQSRAYAHGNGNCWISYGKMAKSSLSGHAALTSRRAVKTRGASTAHATPPS